MKRSLFGLVFVIPILMAVAQEDGLEGRRITLKADDHMSTDVPLTLPFEGKAPEKRVQVLEPKTGKTFPVTIRNGEFVFVSEGAMPNTDHEYVVIGDDSEAPPRVVIEKRPDADALDVIVDDELVTTYYYSKENKKPYLWPLNVLDGVTVTRDWPMGEKRLSTDHPHHKSCWTAYGDVNGADCWTEGDKAGYQAADEVKWGSGDAYGWILSVNTWMNNAKEPVVSEIREYRFYATPAKGRLFDVAVTFVADRGDVLFKDTKEGGLISVRVRDDLTEKQGKGVISIADGKTGMADCWGKPSPWCDYSGPIENMGTIGVALFDHPGNLRHPTRWHVRDYGLMGANCFGLSYFTEKEPERKNGDYTLKSGEKLHFSYRVYLHAGDVKEARVADMYADFATPPKVQWAKK